MRAGTAFQHIRNFQNWPTLALERACHISPAILRLRSGEAIRLMDGSAEFYAYQSIYCEHHYDRDFPGLQQDGTVIDLGANVGIFSIYAATRLVPRGRVFAVEASPSCFKVLESNISQCPNISARCGAVEGNGDLWLSRDSLGASIIRSDDSTICAKAPTISAAEVLGHFPRVSLLKANMEGAEYPFVLGSPSALWANVERVAIKWHDGEIARGHRPAELRNRLQSLGFRILREESIWHQPGLTTGITTAQLMA